MPPGARKGRKFLDSLQTWAASFHPSDVVVSFEWPEDAIFERPRRVLINSGQTACFFKTFYPGVPGLAEAELRAYRKITEAELGPDVRILSPTRCCTNEEGFLMGMLLTFVDQQSTLLTAVWPETPISLREQCRRLAGESLRISRSVGVKGMLSQDEGDDPPNRDHLIHLLHIPYRTFATSGLLSNVL
jgi:hypothetical protein